MAGELPFYLTIRTKSDGSAKATLLAEIDGVLNSAKSRFEGAFADIGRLTDRLATTFKRGDFKIDLGLSGLRQATADADYAYQKMVTLRDAATKLAQGTNDTSEATKSYLDALRAQTVEAKNARTAAYDQLETYGQLQSAVDSLIDRNRALAESYRDTYREQAKAENKAFYSQQAVNAVSAPGLNSRAIDNGATMTQLGELAQQYELLDQAAAASAEHTAQNFFKAALGIDQVTKSARESAAVFAQAFEEQDRAAIAAAASLEMAKKAAMGNAAAAAQLRAQLDPAVDVQQRFDAELLRADTLLEAGAISQREYTAAVAMARQNLAASWTTLTQTNQAHEQMRKVGTTAYGAVTNSLRSMRVATVQAGQQLQDIGISLYSGQRASVVFAQQIPQLAFALSGLEGSANKTHDRIGRFATFLSGPWGLAVGLGIGVIAQLITSLFSAGEASDKTGSALDQLSNKLDLSKNSYEALDAVVQEYNKTQAETTARTYEGILAAEKAAEANLKEAESKLALAKASAEANRGQGTAGAAGAYSGSVVIGLQAEINDLKAKLGQSRVARGGEEAKRGADPRYRLQTDFQAERGRLAAEAEDLAKRGKFTAEERDKYARRREESLKRETAALKAYDDAQKQSRRSAKSDDTRLEAFGNPLSPGSYSKSSGYGVDRGTHKHAGVDLSARTGTPVYATQDGVVSFAGKAGAYGNLIKIGHGAGTETRYGHLSSIGVADKQAVKKGDLIGQVGSTGRSTGPHLHYEVRVNGKPVDPTKGKFPMDASKVAEEAEKAREVLQQFGDQSAEKIQRINERFDEQPRLIDAAAAATRDLDETIKELGERRPPGFQQLIADAQAAKAVVADALVRPFRELEEESQKRIQSQRLIVMGREEEAEALSIIWSMEERLGPLTEERKNQVRETVRHEREAMEALRGHKEIMDAYLGAVSSARSELEAILSGTGKIANFQTIFKQLRGKVLTELIFGPALRSLEEFTKKNVFGESVDKLAETTDYASATVMDFADAVAGASRRIIAAQSPASVSGGRNAGSGLGSLYASLTGSANDNGDIVVTASKRLQPRQDRMIDLSPDKFAAKMADAITEPLASALDAAFGTKFFSQMQGVMQGAFQGYITAGPLGAVLGGIGGIPGLPQGISNTIGSVIPGLGQANLAFDIAESFGIKVPKSVKYGILPSLLGNLFGKRPRGGASVTNDSVYAHANDGGITDSLNGSGSSLQSAIKNIADAFGTTVGSYDVGLGRYKDYYQVSSSGTDPRLGNSYFGRDSANSLYDGLDAEAAMRAAVLAALQDGAIQGIKAGAQKLLTSGKDLDAQIQKALDFQGVFDKLKAIKDPVGSALDALDKEFKRLRDIFAEAGASTQEYAQLEELYGMERAKAIKAAQDQITGSLRALYEQLTIGDSGLSLRARLSNAKAAYDPLKARVAAGDVTAYDDFAAAAQTLLDLQRQIYGSQTPYFDLLAEITGLTKTQLDAQTAIADAAAGRDSPFSPVSGGTAANDNTSVVGAIGTSNDILNQININIANLGNLLLTGTGGISTGILPSNQAEYYF